MHHGNSSAQDTRHSGISNARQIELGAAGITYSTGTCPNVSQPPEDCHPSPEVLEQRYPSEEQGFNGKGVFDLPFQSLSQANSKRTRFANDQRRITRMSQSSPLWGHQCLQRSVLETEDSAENLVFRDFLLPPILFFSSILLCWSAPRSPASPVSPHFGCAIEQTHIQQRDPAVCLVLSKQQTEIWLKYHVEFTMGWAHQCSAKQLERKK